MLKAWPTINITWEEATSGLWLPTECVRTQPETAANQSSLRTGWTVWQLSTGSPLPTIGWEWVEVSRGIVARGNLNAVASNVQWLDARAQPLELPPYPQLMHASLIHRLPWQEQVICELAATKPVTTVVRFDEWRIRHWAQVTEET